MFNQYIAEENAIYDGLKNRAELLSEKLNEIEGITCNEVEGAMYAFPSIHFPDSYLEEAAKEGKAADLK